MGVPNLFICIWNSWFLHSFSYCISYKLTSFYCRSFLDKKSFSLNILIKNVPIYGIILSVIFLYFEWDVPGFIENTHFLLTYTTIFLVLMSLGIALSRFQVSFLDSCLNFRSSKSYNRSCYWLCINSLFGFRWFCSWSIVNSIIYA